jgi:hypothetical protein
MTSFRMKNPGPGGRTWGTGAARVNWQLDCFYLSRFLLKFQAIFRLFFLQLMIPADEFFEPELSLALDRALMALEALWT